ncbi:MAG TPA: hypothetical protein VK427_03665, partial [Kofleriaceae bacterium]|nr:hypothetical protein [Kofleriaceae bacterium]
SEDPKVRALAVSVLAKLDGGKVTGGEVAIRKALTDRADQVRAAALSAIPVLAQRRGAIPKDLLATLTSTFETGSWADRPVATRALVRLGARGDMALVQKAVTDKSGFVREAVAESIALDTGLDVILQLSRDEDAQVRAAAAKRLGATKDERAQRRRAELQRDPEKVVRHAAGGT